MIVLGRRSVAETTRRTLEIPGLRWEKSDWMLSSENASLSPTAFLVEQHPETMMPAHFHKQNQFQVFVEGSGRVGGHRIDGLTIHYAGSFTGYGPIVAGPEGLKYMTLRAVYERGANFLSTAGRGIPKGPRRGATIGPVAIPDDEVLVALGSIGEEILISPSAEGLAAKLTRLPPDSLLPPADAGVAQGQFLFVIAGCVTHGEQCLLPWETVFVSAGEAYPTLVAGEGGAALLSLFVPPMHPRYRDVADFAATHAQAGA